MIRHFIYCWIGYWGLVFLLPVHSAYPAVVEAFFLQFAFVFLVLCGYFMVAPRSREIAMPVAGYGGLPATRSLVRLSIYMSLVGFAFLLFDKIYVQQIDYSSGLAVARSQWRDLGEEREGDASSIWSVLGYALASAYYITLVLVVTQSHRFTNRQRLRATILAFVFALANSVITGGRSNFLLIAIVVLSAFSSRKGLRVRNVFASSRQRRYITLICSAVVVYVVYVFYARAKASEELVFLYVVNLLPYMGLEFDEWYQRSVSEGWIGTFANMTILVLGYLTHSFATVAGIVDAAPEHKTIIFNNVASILYKFGLIERPDSDWFLSGRFPSVPGALWHQFGLAGFVILSFAHGVVGALASIWAKARPNRLLPLGTYVLTATTLTLTPFLFAPDFLSFPSVVVAFLILAGVSRLARELGLAGRRQREWEISAARAGKPNLLNERISR